MITTRAVATLALLAIALSPATATAGPETEICARAYENAQTSRADSKLLDAKRELLVCAQDNCPTALRRDCVNWLSQVENEVPAISLRVIGIDGCDRPDAEIAIDGVVVPRAAEGKPVELNPGKHSVRATIGAGPTQTHADQTTVVGSGERQRTVTIAFGNATSCRGEGGAPTAPANAESRAPETTRPKPIPTSVFIFGAVGIAALGVGTGFAISAWSQKGTLDDCKGACGQGDVDTMQRTFVVADVTGLIGLASLAVAGILYFAR